MQVVDMSAVAIASVCKHYYIPLRPLRLEINYENLQLLYYHI